MSKSRSAPLQFLSQAKPQFCFITNHNRLADVMFGDESDEEAKGANREYTFKPKSRGRRKDSDDVDDNNEDDSSESDNDSDC